MGQKKHRNAPSPDRRKQSSGRLDLVPRASDRVIYPPDFGQRYSVFVATQASYGHSGKARPKASAIRHLPEFQNMANAHGIIPTYLLNYAVATDPEAQDVLGPIAAGGHCVIGALLEPWLTPPHEEERSPENSFVGTLPRDLQAAKLNSLTEAITQGFGARPTIYRAGRYGIGPHTAELLEKSGYRMDVSVRPGFDYRAEGGPDFRRHDARAYWVGPESMVVAQPLGATYTGGLRRFGAYLHGQGQQHPRLGGLLARSGGLSQVALTPEDMPLEDAKRAVNTLIADNIPLLGFSMHATSLVPGLTPYVKTSADLNGLYRWWEDMFVFLAQLGVKPIAADAIVAAAWAMR